MDEPDAFLSSAAQQDLLRILGRFASPDDASRADQVVYVTHSPFLIDKNAAHRIRVLAKGADDEGTRVVNDAAHNHYEPLRSALGAFLAETAFIGGENLLVEGITDQVLLAGMSALLRFRQHPPQRLLDLNEVTIVPAGSASEVPYVAYLARGRDELRPPCVALLDGDKPGKDAIKKLSRDQVNGRQILATEFILDLEAWSSGASLQLHEKATVIELEDLVPIPILVEAGRAFAGRMLGASEDDAAKLTTLEVEADLAAAGGRPWKAFEQAFARSFEGARPAKVGFAKELIAYTERVRDGRRPPGLKALEANFDALTAELAKRLRQARLHEEAQRRNSHLKRLCSGFLDDHPTGIDRDTAELLFQEIESGLGSTLVDEEVRNRLLALRREFNLANDPLNQIDDYPRFREALENLPRLPHHAIQQAALS